MDDLPFNLEFGQEVWAKSLEELHNTLPQTPDKCVMGFVEGSQNIYMYMPQLRGWKLYAAPGTEVVPSHTLILIGCKGIKKAYLDVSEEEARRRFQTEIDSGMGMTDDLDDIKTFKFTDEFNCYDAWEL